VTLGSGTIEVRAPRVEDRREAEGRLPDLESHLSAQRRPV
jgi:hypothetical protein